jgi:hypothetical protein
VDVFQEIENLVAFEGRYAGTDAERRAARHLVERLEGLGRDAHTEPMRVRPAYAFTHMVHAALAVVASVLAVYVPIAGAALALIVAASAVGDLTASFFLVRMLTGPRASQNVVSDEDEGKPGRLILAAHYDAAKTGLVFSPRYARRRLGLVVYFWSLVAVLACTLVRLIGVDGTFFTVVQFIPTVVLIAAVALFADIALSQVVPGANDNASGVGTVLRLADRYGGRLEHFDVAVVFTGAEEGFALGMRNWIKRNREELDAEATAVIAVDMAGYGTPRFATKEGLVFATRFHPTLLELAEGIEGAEPYVSRSISDAYAARAAGLPALRVSSIPGAGAPPHYHLPTDTADRLDRDALERTYEFCCELIERIDAEIGPRLA